MDIQIDTSDPAALAALFNKVESGQDITTNIDTEVKEPPKEEVQADKQAVDQPKSEETKDEPKAEPEQEPEGVATKDGKHIIPYSVMKAERERASRAEQALREAQEKLAQFEAQKAGKEGVNGEVAAATKPAAEEMSDDDLEALREDFPTVYKALMATRAEAAALKAQLKPVQEKVQMSEAERAQALAEQVQEAIDATPKLAHIKATDPAAFELAKGFDNMLKGQPEWADKPLAARFAKVIELVEGAKGAINLPGQPKNAPAQKTAEELKAEAQAVAAKAAKATGTSVPTSLSEFAAGQAPAKDEVEALENMTPFQLAAKFATMSPEKMEAYLQNL